MSRKSFSPLLQMKEKRKNKLLLAKMENVQFTHEPLSQTKPLEQGQWAQRLAAAAAAPAPAVDAPRQRGLRGLQNRCAGQRSS